MKKLLTSAFAVALTTSAFSQAPQKKVSVGDFANGGIVFWIDETGQEGLVCAKEDLNEGKGLQWYNGKNITVGASKDGVKAGKENTTLIIAKQGKGKYAAQLCADSNESYGDWYLPSKAELHMMFQNRAAIDKTAEAYSGKPFGHVSYWSSTESKTDFVWYESFDPNDSGQSDVTKFQTFLVRPVRSFKIGVNDADVFDYDGARAVFMLDQKLKTDIDGYVAYTKQLHVKSPKINITLSVSVSTTENYYTLELITPGLNHLAGGGLGNRMGLFAYSDDWNVRKDTQAIYANGVGLKAAIKDLETKFNGVAGRISITGSGDAIKGQAIIAIEQR